MRKATRHEKILASLGAARRRGTDVRKRAPRHVSTKNTIPQRLIRRLKFQADQWRDDQRLTRLTRAVAENALAEADRQPVVVFNASTRLSGLSLNAAFSLITAWGLRLAGVPVIHFVCEAGMSRCVLGTRSEDHTAPPPCEICQAKSRSLFAGAATEWFTYAENLELSDALQGLTIREMSALEFDGLSFGALVLPSLRWAMRRHHLLEDEPTRFLMRSYILSAHSIHHAFSEFLDRIQPAVVLLFNGLMFPEAAARYAAMQRGVRVVTHEVGFQPFSAFFTDGDATAYPINIPDEFELSSEQSARLDRYLEQRFRGDFTMAGIRFWPDMRGLEPSFLERTANFEQLVPVFTNVVFDTSQLHANAIFEHMFEWLGLLLEEVRLRPETLFIFRAHPDEMREGKESQESVADWVTRHQADKLPNVVFIEPRQYLSSYELIQRSKFVLVYNSSIGLEASLLGIPVLCAGRARYTKYPTAFLPETRKAYREQLREFLSAAKIEVPESFRRNARRFLYYQLFRASIPFDAYLTRHQRPSQARWRPFAWQQLLKENSPSLKIVIDGIVEKSPFLMPEGS